MPVMLPSWVERCWEEGLRRVVSATEPEVVSPLECVSVMTSFERPWFLPSLPSWICITARPSLAARSQ